MLPVCLPSLQADRPTSYGHVWGAYRGSLLLPLTWTTCSFSTRNSSMRHTSLHFRLQPFYALSQVRCGVMLLELRSRFLHARIEKTFTNSAISSICISSLPQKESIDFLLLLLILIITGAIRRFKIKKSKRPPPSLWNSECFTLPCARTIKVL